MFKKIGLAFIVLVSGAFASSMAFAVDHSAAITAAQVDATLSVTTVATAVIAVVAILFGINLIIGMIKR